MTYESSSDFWKTPFLLSLLADRFSLHVFQQVGMCTFTFFPRKMTYFSSQHLRCARYIIIRIEPFFWIRYINIKRIQPVRYRLAYCQNWWTAFRVCSQLWIRTTWCDADGLSSLITGEFWPCRTLQSVHTSSFIPADQWSSSKRNDYPSTTCHAIAVHSVEKFKTFCMKANDEIWWGIRCGSDSWPVAASWRRSSNIKIWQKTFKLSPNIGAFSLH
jgi:hypothetical protein